jgi:uncharacterized protein (DUF1330 family)
MRRRIALATYIVGDIHISDHASYQAHLPRALATIARFGGRGGGKIDLLEGDPVPERIFIIEFRDAGADLGVQSHQPILPIKPKRCRTIPRDYKFHGTTTPVRRAHRPL